MRSGSRSYLGGVKLCASRELGFHLRHPDHYGCGALRSSTKPAKGAPKEDRASQIAEHECSSAGWKEHCPANIDQDEGWETIGRARAPCGCAAARSSSWMESHI